MTDQEKTEQRLRRWEVLKDSLLKAFPPGRLELTFDPENGCIGRVWKAVDGSQIDTPNPLEIDRFNYLVGSFRWDGRQLRGVEDVARDLLAWAQDKGLKPEERAARIARLAALGLANQMQRTPDLAQANGIPVDGQV